MHIHTLDNWRHGHDFTLIHEKGELRTKQVLALTVITMALEIFAGTVYGSMALLADGWHMGTHAAAFTITIFAYRYSQKHVADRTASCRGCEHVLRRCDQPHRHRRPRRRSRTCRSMSSRLRGLAQRGLPPSWSRAAGHDIRLRDIASHAREVAPA